MCVDLGGGGGGGGSSTEKRRKSHWKRNKQREICFGWELEQKNKQKIEENEMGTMIANHKQYFGAKMAEILSRFW